MSSEVLEKVHFIKDLGITIDRKFKFSYPISKTLAKTNSMLGILRRNTAKTYTNI